MKTSLFSKFIGVLAFVVVVLYFGTSIVSYFLDPLKTTVAYKYRSEESISATGYVVREEEVLPSADSSKIYLPREEGERVSKGGRVAVVYHSSEALDAAFHSRELELQLDQLEYASGVLSGAQIAKKLDDSILSDIYALRRSVVGQDPEEAQNQASNLRALSVRRDFAHSSAGAEELEAQIEELRQELNRTSAVANSGRTSITVDKPGFFSALSDGYESVLTPQSLEDMTPSALDAVTPRGETSNVGKLVTGNTWYFAANLRSRDARLLNIGDRVLIRFAGGLDRDLETQVQSISQEENGQQTVVLSSDTYLSLTTLLRKQTAQLIHNVYDGIRVPKNAVRVVEEPVEHEDGTTEVNRFNGVYCRIGLMARIKPVRVLYEGEDYYLVEPDPEILKRYPEKRQVIRTLRGGDEVIITASELYDGKVVS